MSDGKQQAFCQCGHEYEDHARPYDETTGRHAFAHSGPCNLCDCAGFKKRATRHDNQSLVQWFRFRAERSRLTAKSYDAYNHQWEDGESLVVYRELCAAMRDLRIGASFGGGA